MTDEIKTYGPDDFESSWQKIKRKFSNLHRKARKEQKDRCPFNEDQ